MMNTPIVSILIPCYNAAQFIEETLASALRQTWPHTEIIVVDDGSTDASAGIVERYAARGVQLIAQVNQGAPAARNRALEKAKGEWYLFLDADDALEDDFVETQMRAVQNTDADLCFGSSVMVWPDGRRIDKNAMPADTPFDSALAQVLTDGWYPPNALLWRKSFIERIGGWDATLRRNEDGEILQRALLSNAAYTSSSGSRAIYVQHPSPNRVSNRKDRLAFAANIEIGMRMHPAIHKRADLPLSRAGLARSMAELANEAYFHDHNELGRKAETIARFYGALQHNGSSLHRIACQILGMEMKARVSRWVNSDIPTAQHKQ